MNTPEKRERKGEKERKKMNIKEGKRLITLQFPSGILVNARHILISG
jgi:hypothetical protein